jgi:uncharacterized membrane protein YgdD (TMEM256/DUF423 family)
MTAHRQLVLGSLLCGLAVLLGAFAAHTLKDSLDAYHLDVFRTGADYHMTHALALVACGLLSLHTERPCTAAANLFLAGILLFSGSLYLLAVTGRSWLGAVTPIGGAALVTGWILLARHAHRHRHAS